VDLFSHVIEIERRKCPEASNLLCEDASQLSFENESFDLFFVMTVFSSIPDGHLCWLLSQDMLQVLRHGCSILWYDLHVNHPDNSEVRRVTNHEIKDLSSGCSVELHRIALAPPLGRAMARIPIVYWPWSDVRSLGTDYLGWITRK